MASASGVEAPPQASVAAAPMLTLKDPAAAIAFYVRAFGAVEEMRLTEPGGAIAHAELSIGGARIMLSHEYPDLGYLSAETLGGSPIGIHLYVDDVDALVARAAAAGAAVLRPPSDEFYGDRAGSVRDPFGIKWHLATRKQEVPVEEMQRRLDAMTGPPAWKPKGFRSLTPYLLVKDAARFVEFAKQAFGAVEASRYPAPDGTIMHGVLQVGDSMLELSDGGPGFPPRPAALHVYVPDVDAAYARAIAAGCTTLYALGDRPYGDREGDVRDPFGNNWYIATRLEDGPVPEGMHTLTPTLHVKGTDGLIDFIKRAFGAEEGDVHRAPDGTVMHAQLRLDDSVLELGEAHGIVEPMPCSLHLYVPDVDAVYARALAAGAQTIGAPSDRPYGDRAAEVSDPFGNQWYIATHKEDVTL